MKVPIEYSLKGLLLYFLKLGTIGFGGPVALVGYMEQDLMEKLGWITKEEYLRGLTLAQLAPGPLAAQLAIYIGFIKGRIIGATLVGVAFILPSFIMVVLLGVLYAAYGGFFWMQALFYGIGAAAIGIMAKSAYKLTKLVIKKNYLFIAIFLFMAVVTVITEKEIIWLFILSGIVALLFNAARQSKLQALRSFSPFFVLFIQSVFQTSYFSQLNKIFFYFLRASFVVFGSGLAIVPFLHGGVVLQNHWLNEKQFLDAVAVAMITPGPVVITVGFIGYLVAGLPGAAAASLGVFLPVYLFVILPAPYIERYSTNSHLKSFIEGVTAAATGAITGAIVILGRHAITDYFTLAVALGTTVILFRYKIPEPILILAAAILGLIAFSLKG
ncbi:MAG: chromate efflux transporter [Ignavibacteria bacterium]|jgi:chromate transporter|nr:chromate efflux transporter [Ignavibacteria bacterium]MCU7511067.1 chromate efflux transporter [Ignavibacteria bacterium]MCU7525900.1 chromate efflux transporter [Ignavibacteria bacterium]HEX2927930.1 chromate efflux transporter [Ruminiclostridium sp.]